MKQMQAYRRRRVGCAPRLPATDDELVRRRYFRGGRERAECNHRRIEFDAHAVRRNKRALLAARFLLRVGLVVIAILMAALLMIGVVKIQVMMPGMFIHGDVIAMMRAVAVVIVIRRFVFRCLVVRVERGGGAANARRVVRMVPATTQQHVQGQRDGDEISNERTHEVFRPKGFTQHHHYRPAGQDCFSIRR